jgi:hypothetical protein
MGMAASNISHLSLANRLFWSDAMDQLGCRRYCCRRMIMTHVDLIEKLLRYISCHFGILWIVAHLLQLQFRRERSLQGSSVSQSIFSRGSTCHRLKPRLSCPKKKTSHKYPVLPYYRVMLGRLSSFVGQKTLAAYWSLQKKKRQHLKLNDVVIGLAWYPHSNTASFGFLWGQWSGLRCDGWPRFVRRWDEVPHRCFFRY